MPYIKQDVTLLLERSFDQIEELWDADPYDLTKVFALTIKEYMQDHNLSAVEEGVEQFMTFKTRQVQGLRALGLENTKVVPALLLPNISATGGR